MDNKSIKNLSLIKYPSIFDCNIAVIGLGYVGLPLAIQFSIQKNCLRTNKPVNRKVIGFDVNKKRIEELTNLFDRTKEVSYDLLKLASENISFTSKIDELENIDVFIITVPTPIDLNNKPNLEYIKSATRTVANLLIKRKYNNTKLPFIIYESTFFPGATEEICIPIIEEVTNFKLNEDFFCGYSPERINPGDKKHRLTDVIKVTSGSNIKASKWIDNLYRTIIKAGTFRTNSIKVAEAAKVIENTQRDINIALINELAIIFDKMDINTNEVIEAASTKWNFQGFKPGLVGGHCIGVDPYYLTFKSEQLGYYPEIVLSGRRINNSMSKFVVQRLILELLKNEVISGKVHILILGLSFKENCPDIRNTKVIDIINELQKYNFSYEVVDPVVDVNEASKEYNLKILNNIPQKRKFDAVLVAVAHNQFLNIDEIRWRELLKKDGILYDLKGVVNKEIDCLRL